MKKMLLMAGLLVCSLATFAYEPASNDGSMLLAQNYNREQVVRAYSTGKDYVGKENWTSVIPHASIRATNSSFDGNMAREFDNTATLTLSNGYQTSSLKIYF